MTEYVQHLVKERVEKERLERELEIAKEVQERLFPNRVPQMERMDVAGICLPARTVSGDYYDFLPLGSHQLGNLAEIISFEGIVNESRYHSVDECIPFQSFFFFGFARFFKFLFKISGFNR